MSIFAIEKIIYDHSLRKYISKRAKKLSNKYSWKRCADQTWAFIINTYRSWVMIDRQYRICKNCVMDTSDSCIEFDENGQCIYCNNFYNIILPKWNKILKTKNYRKL